MSSELNLIGIGPVPAVPLSEIKAGDRLMWNYGQVYEVVSARRVGAKTIELTERKFEDGPEYTRRKRADRLVVRVTGDGYLWHFTG